MVDINNFTKPVVLDLKLNCNLMVEFHIYNKATFYGSDGLAIEVTKNGEQVQVSPIFTLQKNKDINSIIVFHRNNHSNGKGY